MQEGIAASRALYRMDRLAKKGRLTGENAAALQSRLVDAIWSHIRAAPGIATRALPANLMLAYRQFESVGLHLSETLPGEQVLSATFSPTWYLSSKAGQPMFDGRSVYHDRVDQSDPQKLIDAYLGASRERTSTGLIKYAFIGSDRKLYTWDMATQRLLPVKFAPRGQGEGFVPSNE